MEKSKELQGVIAKMLKPLKNLSLSIVIEGLSGYQVKSVNKKSKKDNELINNLKKVAKYSLKEINKTGILRPRPNEVGNDIENYVKDALNKYKYKGETPKGKSGKKKSTGYPDIIFYDFYDRAIYLECKTFNIDNINKSFRSFYLSPSNDFKITEDAFHLGISFEIYIDGNNKNNHIYKCKSWKILDLSKLLLDVKYEFNSNNKRMYEKKLILAEGEK